MVALGLLWESWTIHLDICCRSRLISLRIGRHHRLRLYLTISTRNSQVSIIYILPRVSKHRLAFHNFVAVNWHLNARVTIVPIVPDNKSRGP